jgi:hypothetical protein
MPVARSASAAELVGDGERVARGHGRRGLELGRDAVLLEQLAPEPVVEDLGLDHVAVELRGDLVAAALAQGDELGVAHLGDRLARERPRGDALDRASGP